VGQVGQSCEEERLDRKILIAIIRYIKYITRYRTNTLVRVSLGKARQATES